jgi:acyl-CoA thioesterase FadM
MPSTTPYIHIAQIRFADTDAAGIAYTGRFANFAMDAIDGWFRDRLDTDWFRLNIDEGIGTPFVHMSMDFRSPLTPRDMLQTMVLIPKAGTTSLTFNVAGRVGTRVSFEGRFVCVFVDRIAAKPIEIPARYRGAIAAEVAIFEATAGAKTSPA